MRLTVSFSPHRLQAHTLASYNMTWIMACIPPALAGFYFFGLRVLVTLVVGAVSAMAGEALIQKISGKGVDLSDNHSALVGIMLGLTMSPITPWWVTMLAAFLGIILGKMVFGGKGYYPFNPILVGYMIAYISWPDLVANFVEPAAGSFGWPELSTAVAPIMAVHGDPAEVFTFDLGQLFMGDYPGPIGATSVPALVISALILMSKGYLKIGIPIGMIIGLGWLAGLYHAISPEVYPSIQWHLVTGTFLLAAVLIGPEPTTTPVSGAGKFLFGLGAGMTAFFIRTYGAHPDGIFYGVLVFNALTPILDRIKPKPVGRTGLA